MREKRFLWIGEHTIIDNKTGDKYSSLSSCLLLNRLNDENEQLRQDHKRQENQIKLLNKRLSQIPKGIREVWLE